MELGIGRIEPEAVRVASTILPRYFVNCKASSREAELAQQVVDPDGALAVKRPGLGVARRGRGHVVADRDPCIQRKSSTFEPCSRQIIQWSDARLSHGRAL